MSTVEDTGPPTGEAVRRGLARPEKVITYYQGVLSEFPDIVQDLQSLRELITGMSVDDNGTRILRSIAASILNQTFEQYGWCCHVTDDNEFGVVYYHEGPQREMLWKGLINQP